MWGLAALVALVSPLSATVGAGDVSSTGVPTPANDDPEGASVVSPGTAIAVEMTGATATRPASPRDCGEVEADVFYRLTVPASGRYRLGAQATGVDADPIVVLYRHRVGTARVIDCNDDASDQTVDAELTVDLDAGTTYIVRVASHHGTTGAVQLLVESVADAGASNPEPEPEAEPTPEPELEPVPDTDTAAPAATTDGSITGIVTSAETGEPLGGICMLATAGNRYSAVTSPTGTYHFTVRGGREYRVSANNCRPVDNRFAVGSARVSVDVGELESGIDIALKLAPAISGVVTDELTGAPAADVCVTLRSSRGSGRASERTTPTGSYRFAPLSTGTYRVSFSDCGPPDGIPRYRSEHWDDRLDGGDLISVALDSPRRDINAALTPVAAITGTVTDRETGESIMGLCVQALDSTTEALIDETTTSPTGSYALVRLPAGTYRVRVEDCRPPAGPLGLRHERYPPHEWTASGGVLADGGPGEPIALTDAQRVAGIDVVMDPIAVLLGTVTDASEGSPIAGICIVVYDDVDPIPIASTTTLSTGAYRLTNVRGSYRVGFIDCNGRRDYRDEYFDDQPSLGTAGIVTITSLESHRIDAQLTPFGGTIVLSTTDEVTGLPVSYACVNLFTFHEYYGLRLITSDVTSITGVLRLTGLDPDRLYAISAGDCSYSYGRYAQEFYDDSPDLTDAHPLILHDGESIRIEIDLLPTGGIQGVVTGDRSGQPLADVCVSAGGANTSATARTSATGSYLLSGLYPGDYFVRFSDCSFGGDTVAAEHFDDVASGVFATPVPVRAGRVTRGINASLSRPSVLTGSVTSARTGRPVVSVCVAATNVDDPFDAVPSVATDRSGIYRIAGLRRGRYVVRFYDCLSIARDISPQWYAGAERYVDARPVEVDDDEVVAGIDAEMEVGGSIEGIVTNSRDARVLRDICVQAFVADGGSPAQDPAATAYTNRSGIYRLIGLAKGEYDIHFSSCVADLYSEEWYDDADSRDAATTVELDRQEHIRGINAALAYRFDLGYITGTVTWAADGRGVDTCVQANGPSGSFGVGTSRSGAYRVLGLEPGMYRVSAISCTAERHGPTGYGGAISNALTEPVVVRAGQTTSGVDIQVHPPVTISGTVSAASDGHALINVCVTAEDEFGNDLIRVRTLQTSMTGSYRIDELAPGRYRIEFNTCSENRYAAEGWSNAHFDEPRRSIELAPGETIEGIDAQLEAGGAVRLWIATPGSVGITGCIRLLDSGGRTRLVQQLDLDGYRDEAFTFEAIPVGDYTLYFEDCGGRIPLVAEYWKDAPSFARATMFHVGPGEEVRIGAILDAAEGNPECGGKTATRVGTPRSEVIWGTNAADVIAGLGGNDIIWALSGNDIVCGGAGDDIIVSGFGNDHVDGGEGNDTINLFLSFRSVHVDLYEQEAYGEGNDTLIDVEGAIGSFFADFLAGDDQNNGFEGFFGDDVILGREGNDLLSGWSGDDHLFGGAGDDRLRGAAGTDRLDGGDGTDHCKNGTAIHCERGRPGDLPGWPTSARLTPR